MLSYCTLCQRSFKKQEDLDQHLRTSSAHKKPTKGSSRAQNPPQAKLPAIPKQQDQVIPSPRRSQRLQQALGAPSHIYSAAQVNHVQLQNAVASSSSAPQIKKPAAGEILQRVESRWSVISVSQYGPVLDALSARCQSPEELKASGFILDPYNHQSYINSRKCKRCNCKEAKASHSECTFHPSKRNKWNLKKPYKCCWTTDGKGCTTLPVHDFQLPLRAIKHKDFQQTPAATGEPKFRAIALDCEMAGIASGDGEVIFLCAIDCITGAVLINRLVYPQERITQMRSEIHGISKSTLDTAVLQGQALSGWEGARSELWKYIDDNTILVGHALQNDLDALRLIHPRVVDSSILARSAVGCRRGWGLQALCEEFLGIEIRKNKAGIHDCLEDVLATREVVLFCIQQNEAFQSWVSIKKEEERRKELERERVRKQKENEKAMEDASKASKMSRHTHFGLDDDDEVVHWSDIAEDLGWPHPDTGYDPWSD